MFDPQPSSSAAQMRVLPSSITAMSDRAQVVLDGIRSQLVEPFPRKAAPVFKSSQLAALIGEDRKRIDYLVRADSSLPTGSRRSPTSNQRQFTLEEVITWVEKRGGRPTRPEGVLGSTICFSIFKGGVSKTTTAVSMAQALTLRGCKVLLIDTDPQGSATQLLGYAPDAEISVDKTILPIFYDPSDPEYRDTLAPSILPTYWKNLDLIGSCSTLFTIEMFLHGRIKADPTFEFWTILKNALVELREVYDVVIIDTPPQISNGVINAVCASDGIIAPLPPASLDFASSIEFFRMLAEFIASLDTSEKINFQFLNVLMTKVKNTPATAEVMTWINQAFAGFVLPITIPDSRAIDNAAAAFATIYDTPTPDGSVESYDKARQPMDALADYLFAQISRNWRQTV